MSKRDVYVQFDYGANYKGKRVCVYHKCKNTYIDPNASTAKTGENWWHKECYNKKKAEWHITLAKK